MKIEQYINDSLLSPYDISLSQIDNLISYGMSYNLDYVDLYFQKRMNETWCLLDNKIKQASINFDGGVGYRGVKECQTSYSYTEDFNYNSIHECASVSKYISDSKVHKINNSNIKKIKNKQIIYPPCFYANNVKYKIDLLRKVDELCFSIDARVTKVEASLSISCEDILIANHEQYICDVRPLVRINISVISEENGKKESSFSGGGGRYSVEELGSSSLINKLCHDAVNESILKLSAKDSPSGEMTVVLGPGWPGVLLHEAVGHGLEGDFIRKKSSAFTNRLGEKVASDQVTVIDNGSLKGKRGSLNIDDEGVETQENILIEKGILKKYLTDKINAKALNMPITGNGRRESYACAPMPRMTNTYMMPGQYTHDEIISSVKKGIYAINFDGGQVDITSGKFVFSSNHAFMIENGKITYPIRDASLIGDGHISLSKIDMVGNNLLLDNGIGICGKDGQSVPVGVGMPSVRISKMVVGGVKK